MPKRLASQQNSGRSKIEMPMMIGEAFVRADTFKSEDNTVEVLFATDAQVRRRHWQGDFMEVLSIKEEHMRMERINTGAMSLLDSHDGWSMDYRLGVVLADSIRFEKGKVYARVQISKNNARAQVLLKDLADGMPFPVSVGYKIYGYVEKDAAGDGALPIRTAVDWEPYEISAVPVPADAGASSRNENAKTNDCVLIRQDMTAASAASTQEKPMNKRDAAKNFNGEQLDAFAAAFGMSRKKDEDDDAFLARLLQKFDEDDAAEEKARKDAEAAEAKRNADAEAGKRKNKAPETGTVDAPVLNEERIGEIAAESAARTIQEMMEKRHKDDEKRKADILALGKRFGFDSDADLVRTAIGSNQSYDEFREALLTAIENADGEVRTNHAGAKPMSGQDLDRRSAAVDYLVARSQRGMKLEGQAADFRGMSMIDLARTTLEWAGVRTTGMTPNEIAKRALSTGDFPIILSNLAGKTLAAAYEAAPKTFEVFVRSMNISDFKPRFIIRKGLAPQMQLKGENGEYRYGNFAESKEQIKLLEYGVAVRMTRQMLINDELGAFTSIATEFGQSAATLESDIVWGLILSNPVLGEDNVNVFHANHGNLGSAAALSEAALSGARVAMSKQTDLDKKTVLNISPKYLAVPPELETTAEKLMTQVASAKTDDVVPRWIRTLQPVSDPRLSLGVSKAAELGINASGSATAWYLLSDQVDNVVTAYMEGQNGVYTEEMVDFDTDGLKIKARHDFGAAYADFRGSYKNPGA